MSQETPSNQKPYPLADAIAAVGRGDLSHRVLISFSDLDRERARELARAWSAIDSTDRSRLIQALDELAENSVLYHFGRVFRIGLDDADAAVRQRSLSALWEEESSDLIDRFMSRLDDESQDVRAEAARALGTFAKLAAEGKASEDDADLVFDRLDEIANDATQAPVVRRCALESLAAFGKRGDVPQLIRDAYDDEDQTLRAGALFAMGRTLDTRWLNTLLSEFENDDPEMRYEAARACGELGDNAAVEGLARLTGDPDAEVRFAAVTALGKIASPGAARVLRRMAERASGEEQAAIEDALEQISAMEL